MSDDPNLVSAQFGARVAPARQMRRVPFRIVVIGDFGLPAGRLHGFDDQDPDTALAAATPTLSLEVADRLTGADRPLAVSLTVEALRDFTPQRLVDSVPQLAAALSERETLRKSSAPVETPADKPAPAPAKPAPPPPAPAPDTQSDDPLDRLFDLVDSDTPSPNAPPPEAPDDAPAKRAVSAFIGAMGGRRATAAAHDSGAVGEIEGRIADQIAAILDSPDFRRLETAWRGLRFLLRHSDRRAQCFVHVISAAKEEAATTARATLIDAADQQPAGLGLLVSAHDYGSGPNEVAQLQALAEVAAEIQVPVVAAASPKFLHDGEDGLADMRDPETVFQDAAYAPWNSLRAKQVARWLAVTVNRFQLRGPHDLTADRRLAFSPGSEHVGAPLEAGGAWLVAAMAAESAAESGWPSELTGAGRAIDGLPLYGTPEDAGNVYAVALPLRPDAAANLGNAGLIALVGQANLDTALLVRVPSVRTARADPTGNLPREGTFDYQLVVSRLIRQIEGNADLIFAAGSPDGIREAMESFLAGLMGPGADVSVALETDDEDETVLAIRVVTGREILGGVTVQLDLPV